MEGDDVEAHQPQVSGAVQVASGSLLQFPHTGMLLNSSFGTKPVLSVLNTRRLLRVSVHLFQDDYIFHYRNINATY